MKRFGVDSMVTPLRRAIVKRPEEAFGGDGSIGDQWEALHYTGRPDFRDATREHAEFRRILTEGGVEVLELPADERTGLDSLYPQDAGLVGPHGVITFRLGKPERSIEGAALGDALLDWDIPTIGHLEEGATAEGGDTLWLDSNTLVVGRGLRTNALGINRIGDFLGTSIDVVPVDLPHCKTPGDVLHLTSFISLLDQDLAVVHRPLVPPLLLEMLHERNFGLVDIEAEEWKSQACNVLAVSPRNIVMLAGNPVTRGRMENTGCTVTTFVGNEISARGCGGPTCLVRPLARD